ncbi:MAG: hypothetical protein J5865_00325 [Lachnospiraceae bacterium]|nr:hypothetical protein [Lachnospiraceae bacterium]
MYPETEIRGTEEGSFTAEAAFVVSLTLLAVLTAVLMSFYLRDVCAAAARIRQESLGSAVTEIEAEPGPVFTLTDGRLAGSGGTKAVSLKMDGVWPLSRLRFSETVSRGAADPVRLLRQNRQEGLR